MNNSFNVLFFVLSLSFPIFFLNAALSSNSILHDDDHLLSQDYVNCLQSNSNDSTSIAQFIYTPENASFIPFWQSSVGNSRFNKPSTPKPLVILAPVLESQIKTIVQCTKKYNYELRIRCAGHDTEGISSTSNVPFVMIDLRNMKSINVDVSNKTAWVQAGATLGELYYAISQKTNTMYFPAGVGGGVGVGGHISGGGYGVLLRKYGLAVDNVLDAHFMDANGRILDRKSMGEDLFWAIRGGGASSFGIVLAWKLRLVPVPEKVTYFQVAKTLEENATAIFHKYQYVAPTTDENLLISVEVTNPYIGNTTNKTINIVFTGLYLGTTDKLLPLIEETFPELGVTEEICQETNMVHATLFFNAFPSSVPPEIYTNRTAMRKFNQKSKSDFVRTPIPISELEKIWEKVLEIDGPVYLDIYPFGGKMNEYPETATPYPHRAGISYEILKTVAFFGQDSDTTPVSLQRIRGLQSLEEFVTPYVSKNPREAYLNYIDLDFGVGNGTYEEARVWGERYWKRSNFQKLIRIKSEVDPENFFRHPQSIPLFPNLFSGDA